MSEAMILRPFGPAERPCKVCGGASAWFGAADFNRSCEDAKGPVLPRSGIEVPYRRCGVCGLIFTETFDDWSHGDFARWIYNDDYIRVDPEFASIRPSSNAVNIAKLFPAAKGEIRLLDYGGGAGEFARALRGQGYEASTYDPFDARHAQRPHGRFNLITCFEVIEHMADPVGGVADIASFLDDEALILFTTLRQPAEIAEVGMRWWYIGPRNGHITLHSADSLKRIWAAAGLRVLSFNDNNHVAARKAPPFARAWLSRTPAPA